MINARGIPRGHSLRLHGLRLNFKPRSRLEILCSQNLGVKFRLLNLAAECASKALNFVGFCARLCLIASVLKF